MHRLTPVTLVGTCFGVGLLPGAPGTYGTVVAAVVIWPLWACLTPGGVLPISIAGGLVVAATLLGVALAPRVERALGRHDPKQFVLDEVAGYWLAMIIFPPLVDATLGWLVFLEAVRFAAFRLFDVWKPWPVGRLDAMPGPWGVMLDDLAAGVWAGLVSWGVLVVSFLAMVYFVLPPPPG